LSLLQNHCPKQLGTPVGLPLYHDAMILLFFAMIAPDLNFIQLARVAAMIADNIKYSSRVGRICFSLSILLSIENKKLA
jgi:hypothetical protein